MFVIFSVFYILIAAAMIVLILMQRGKGADAGASFGGGSSGTVFGSSGSSSFLGRATSALAVLFFVLSLGMAVYLSHSSAPAPADDLGVMSGIEEAPIESNEAPAPKTTDGEDDAIPSSNDDEPKDTGKSTPSDDSEVPVPTGE